MTTMGSPEPDPAATARFRSVATEALAVLFEADPVWASEVGQRRFDSRLPDLTLAGAVATAADLADATSALDDLDDAHLDPQDQVDLEILRTRLTARLWAYDELAEQTWNPLLTAPDRLISTLMERDLDGTVRCEPDRGQGLIVRLAQLGDYLAAVREQWGVLPRPHAELAVERSRAAAALLRGPVGTALRQLPNIPTDLPQLLGAAVSGIQAHAGWLADQVPVAVRDPRLGARDFAAKLWYSLDTETLPDPLLDRAERAT
jgi:hypothetical protein